MQCFGNLFEALILFTFSAIIIAAPIYAEPTNLKKPSTTLTIVYAADMPDISDPISGKYAQLATLVREQREANENVFFIFGGDAIGPSALATFDRGSHIIDLLNSIEPDAMGITKREFSFFEDELSLRAQEAAFPLITSNMIDARTGQNIEGIASSVVIEKDNITLGIISLMHEQVINEYLLKHAKVIDPFTALTKHAKALKSSGVDVVLLHYSYPFNFINVLLQQGMIDVALLSDSHLSDTYFQESELHPNILAVNKLGTAVVGQFAFDTSLQMQSRTDFILANLTPSIDIEAQVRAYQNRLDRLLDIQIGVWDTNVTTQRRQVRSGENRFANFIVDTMLEYSQADIALINGGSIRGNTQYQTGEPITRRTILTELPYLSALKTMNVLGADLVAALENGVSNIETFKGGFPHVAGLEVVINSDKAVGMRVVSALHKGKPIEADKIYKLATTDFLAKGGDGYSLVEVSKNVISDTFSIAPLISELVTQSVIQQRKVNPSIDGRMKNEAKRQQ